MLLLRDHLSHTRCYLHKLFHNALFPIHMEGPRITHFKHNKNFPQKSITVTLSQSLMPVIRCNLRKKRFWNFPQKSKPVILFNFIHSLMPAIRYNFRKIKWTTFEESSKMIILDPKLCNLPHFRNIKDFPQKMSSILYFWILKNQNAEQKNNISFKLELNITALAAMHNQGIS